MSASSLGQTYGEWSRMHSLLVSLTAASSCRTKRRRSATRFMLEHFEAKGPCVFPVKATLDMHEAMRLALDEGKRMSRKWVQDLTRRPPSYQDVDAAA